MIILTGGAGFIGSNILAALTAQGRSDVLVVDSLGTGDKWKNLLGLSFLDIVSKHTFRGQLSNNWGKVETVIHMGACSATTEADADYLYDNNYRYSVDVARFAFDRGARFIYASSAATYGKGELGFNDETRNLRPLNMYGYSKHLFDEWIRDQGLEGSCVGLKFFNVYGMNEAHKGNQASMILKAFGQIRNTGRVQLFKSNSPEYPDGGQIRDFVYVKDCVSVVLNCLANPKVNGIVNLGTGLGRTWNHLAHAVFDAMNMEPMITYIDIPEELSSQYQNYTQADVTKLMTLLPDFRFHTLEEGVTDYVRGYLKT